MLILNPSSISNSSAELVKTWSGCELNIYSPKDNHKIQFLVILQYIRSQQLDEDKVILHHIWNLAYRS